MNGKVLMFPCPIVEGKITSLTPESILNLHNTTHFLVERARTARHFIKATLHPKPISELIIQEINENHLENERFAEIVKSGLDVGIISEAGCPGIADPGAEIVAWAHKNNIKVVPFVGPSSIFMALMASGFSGQSFVFHGYLSNKKPELISQIRQLEGQAKKLNQSQIFMETPYRNIFMIESCTQSLSDNTLLCVACDINAESELILTKKICDWRKADISIYHKRPCIFVLG
jgi:16S rRNA (cytidine1402-2'-O)-methyltransferase